MNPPYQLILADPAWTYRDKAQDGSRGASCKYPCMTLEDIKALPVGELADENCLLALWWVPTQPLEALEVVKAWGFRFVTMKGLTWAKKTKNGKVHIGMGHYTRANTEDCLFAMKGKTRQVIKNRGVRQLIVEEIRAHSQKPEQAYTKLETLCGDVRRLELFAREEREGWDCLGNGIDGRDLRDSLKL